MLTDIFGLNEYWELLNQNQSFKAAILRNWVSGGEMRLPAPARGEE